MKSRHNTDKTRNPQGLRLRHGFRRRQKHFPFRQGACCPNAGARRKETDEGSPDEENSRISGLPVLLRPGTAALRGRRTEVAKTLQKWRRSLPFVRLCPRLPALSAFARLIFGSGEFRVGKRSRREAFGSGFKRFLAGIGSLPVASVRFLSLPLAWWWAGRAKGRWRDNFALAYEKIG